MQVNTIICGAMPDATKGFPDGSINCSISSPPYWALRDYGVDGQLGLEKTFEEYIDKLCTIYDEVKRVLRDDGCCFVNLGDTYASTSHSGVSCDRNDTIPQDCPLRDSILNRPCDGCQEASFLRSLHKDLAVSVELSGDSPAPSQVHKESQSVHLPTSDSLSQKQTHLSSCAIPGQQQIPSPANEPVLSSQESKHMLSSGKSLLNVSNHSHEEAFLSVAGSVSVDGQESSHKADDKPSNFSTVSSLDSHKNNNRNVCPYLNYSRPSQNVEEKSLCLIPQRFAIEMVRRGWILRNCIVWAKPNPMPSSAKDRFTVSHEYVYFFVKSRKYWFEPQYEPHKEPERSTGKIESMGTGNAAKAGQNQGFGLTGEKPRQYNPLGRNKRTVWTIPTQSFPDAHFATFPEKLVEPMIKAGCPEFVCTKCGKAREKIYEPSEEYKKHLGGKGFSKPNWQEVGGGATKADNYPSLTADYRFKGYTDCGCNAEYRPGIMIDIFAGSGTALQVAARLRRDWIGVELKPEYIEMAEKRARQGETGISVKEQKQGQMPMFPMETKK